MGLLKALAIYITGLLFLIIGKLVNVGVLRRRKIFSRWMEKALWQKFWIENSRDFVRILIVVITMTLVFIFPNEVVTSNVLSNLFSGAGAMTGGILAIAFTLNTFLAEQNSYLKSMNFFQDYSNNIYDKFCYFVLSLLTIVYFFLSISVWSCANIFLWQAFLIISIACAVSVIDSMSENISKRTNPKNAIEYLKKKLLKRIDLLGKLAEELSIKLSSFSPDSSNKKILEIYLYQDTLQPFIEEIRMGILDLLSLADNLSKDSSRSTIVAIRAVRDILVQYIEIRKENSLVQLDTDFVLATRSDLEKFFEFPLTELNRLTGIYGERNQEGYALEIMHLYEAVIKKSLEISKSQGLLREENPLSQQIMQFFSDFQTCAYQKNFKEAVFQSHYALHNIAIKSLEEKANVTFSLALNQIDQLIIPLFKLGYGNLIYMIQKALVDISVKLIDFYGDAYMLEKEVEKIFDNVFKLEKLLKDKYENSFIQNNFIHVVLNPYIEFLLRKIISSEDKDKKLKIVAYLRGYVNSLRTLFRENSDFATHYVFESLDEISRGLIDMLKQEKKGALRDDYYLLLNEIVDTSTFCSSKGYIDVLDTLSTVGVRIITEFEELDIKTLHNSIDSIIYILGKQNSNGYDYPRGLLRLHFIGVLLLKHGYLDEYRELRKKIELIDTKDLNKIQELVKFRDDYFYKTNSLRSFTKESVFILMTKIIKVEDLDEYLFYTYGICDDQCSLKKQHDDRIAKQKDIMKFIRILRSIISSD